MSNSPDPGSLSRLHDIVAADAVSWWPPAPGWYFVSTVVLFVLVFSAWWCWRRWQARRYRRQALAELRVLLDHHRDTQSAAIQMLILLKRTALAAYPRTQVAGLSGGRWWAFLDQTADGTEFVATFGPLAAELAYGVAPLAQDDEPRFHSLVKEVERWIVSHHQSGRG